MNRRRPLYRSPLCIFLLIVALFTIGCLFVYWALEDYFNGTFDYNRYEISKVQVEGSDSYMLWKLDKRTGALELCGKTNSAEEPVACLRSSNFDSKSLPKGIELDSSRKLNNQQCTEIIADVVTEIDHLKTQHTDTTPSAGKASHSDATPLQSSAPAAKKIAR